MTTIEDRLKSLGGTAKEVAESLLEKGYKGRMCSSNACPVILFVNDGRTVWGKLEAPRPGVITYDDLQIIDPMCPQPVAEFMRRFDDGEFKELRLT